MAAQPLSTAELYHQAQKTQREGDLESAKAQYLDVLKREPGHADALHCLGNIDARQGQLEDAERLIRRAIQLDPLKATFINSLGNLLKARGRLDDAAAMYRQTIQLEPEFAMAHSNLGETLLRQGNPEDAIPLFAKALEINPNLAGAYDNLGRAFNNMGRLAEAADAFRRAVLIRPEFAVAYDHLGHVLRAMGEMEEARDAFEHAVAIDPGFASARRNLATILMSQGDVEEGIREFESALQLSPGHIDTLINLGIAYHTGRNFKKSAVCYRQALQLDPDNAVVHLNLGLVLNEQRRGEEAEASFQRSLELDPDSPAVYAELAALYEEANRLEELEAIVEKGLQLAPDHPRLNLEAAKGERRRGELAQGLKRLNRFDVANMDPRLAEQFHYQLGYLNDRAGNVDAAFDHFTAANELARATPRAREAKPERFLALLDELHTFFSESSLEAWTPAPASERAAPVFMLGFPRSGTTLVDVVLDSHPGIVTVEEQVTILPALEALEALPDGYPGALANLDEQTFARLRALYFDAIDPFVTGQEGKLVIDKMPIRTIQIGMLWRLFPDARFVFCQRHPCDVVLSNFMQHYTVSDAFANFHSLEDSARIYDKTMRLWQLYQQRLTLNAHVVRYESLIDDLEAETRKLLEFLGLEWDPQVLEYAERARQRGRINTNSYHQVTEALYQRSRDRWRGYARYLEPSMRTLDPHIEYFGYERQD
ncbi:MAG: tetratricopeptide repeat protein [Gammaproteobacteria bacterium]